MHVFDRPKTMRSLNDLFQILRYGAGSVVLAIETPEAVILSIFLVTIHVLCYPRFEDFQTDRVLVAAAGR